MKILLLKPVNNLGLAGSVVNVSDGFAVNYLMPHKLASSNLVVPPQRMEKINNQVLTEQGKKTLAGVSNIQVIIKANANEKGKLYEAIKAGQVAGLLRSKKKINVKADEINFLKPIKDLGVHEINLKIANQVVSFKLIVEKL